MEAKPSNLLPEKVFLDKLVLGKNKQHVVIRVLRMWEARNFKLNGTLMSLDLLLLDEKDILIQGSIFHRRIHKFKDLLKEGNLYQISSFEVVPTYSHYKVTDNPLTIRFTDTTQVIEVAEEVCSIQREKFRLHTYAEFHTFAGTNLHLLDVVGQVMSIQGSNLEDSSSKQKIVLLLLLQDNSTVRVTLWDDQASNFRLKFQQSSRDCNVIVITCLNPKMFAGKLYLNSSGSTKIYIDYNLEVVKDFMKRMGTTDCEVPTIEDDNAKLNLEVWTVEQILEYISSGSNQEKEVICRAKIIDISNRNGWKYLSCATCSKKLARSVTSLVCNKCNKSITIGVARFRVELVVESGGDGTSTFVLFDRDARNITHTSAEDIITSEENDGENSSNPVPKCLQEVIGKTMEFQIKISEYNFQTTTQTFTVTRILPADSNANSITKETEDGDDEKMKSGKALASFATSSKVTELEEAKHGDKPYISEEDHEEKSKKQRLI